MQVIFRVVFTLSVVFIRCGAIDSHEFTCADESCPVDQYLTTVSILTFNNRSVESSITHALDLERLSRFENYIFLEMMTLEPL